LATPPVGTMLLTREVPPTGGDTLFANMYLAYKAILEHRSLKRGVLSQNLDPDILMMQPAQN
jgi:taurine dioxygenase